MLIFGVKLFLVMGQEDRSGKKITAKVCRGFTLAITYAKHNQWVENTYWDGVGQK